MIEIWKTIIEHPDYQVSSFGRVKSFKQDKINGKILKECEDSRNYFIVSLCTNNRKTTKLIHILEYETFNGYKLKSDECVHHKDENKENNYYENLKKMNISDHQKFHNIGEKNYNFGKHRSDEVKNKISEKNKGECHPMFGIKRSGEKSGNHKLTERKIIQIKMLFKLGFKNIEISKIYNISPEEISSIKNKRSWSHIKV
jgi:hypothetical protein